MGAIQCFPGKHNVAEHNLKCRVQFFFLPAVLENSSMSVFAQMHASTSHHRPKLHCIVVYCSAVYFTAFQFIALCTLLHCAVYHSVSQCIVQGSVSQCIVQGGVQMIEETGGYFQMQQYRGAANWAAPRNLWHRHHRHLHKNYQWTINKLKSGRYGED